MGKGVTKILEPRAETISLALVLTWASRHLDLFFILAGTVFEAVCISQDEMDSRAAQDILVNLLPDFRRQAEKGALRLTQKKPLLGGHLGKEK